MKQPFSNCHSERSEESLHRGDSEALRFAQGDKSRHWPVWPLLVAVITVITGCSLSKLSPSSAPRMAKLVSGIVCTTDVAGVYCYYPEMLSEIRRITWESATVDARRELPVPSSFRVAPWEIDLIFGIVTRRFNEVPRYIYFDKSSYYVADAWPSDKNFGSARVMLDKGIKINGKDGTVFNRSTGQWERRGYLHLIGRQVKRLPLRGKTEEQVVAILGLPWKRDFFPRGTKYRSLVILSPSTNFSRIQSQSTLSDERMSDSDITQLVYWHQGGELHIGLSNNVVTSFEPNVHTPRF